MKPLLLFLLATSYLFSAPALDRLREFKQADGTTFMAKGRGNQHLNWIETESGEILKRNIKSKNFEYAEIRNNTLQASGIKYEKQRLRKSKSLQSIEKLSKKSVHKLWKKKREDAYNRRHKNIKAFYR